MALNIPTEGTKLNELKINIVDTQETFEAMKTANKVNANELYFIEQELPIIADSLKTGHTFKVNLASENASTAFNGTADITDIGVSGALPVKHGGTGFTTATYKNAVVIGNSSTVTNQLQTIRTASGAFYATGQDVKPSFGTLPIAQGGTGATSAANARTNLGLGTMATETAANYLKLAGGTMTGGVTFVGNQSSAWNDKGILFTNGSRIGENSSKALGLYSASTFYIRPDSGTASSGKGLEISSTAMIPSVNNEMDLGSSDKKFKAIYATTLNGNLAWSNITSKPTTLSGYGITDAKINNGTITLGNNSITPLTAHQTVTNKNATLGWNTAITVATIGNTDIKISLPTNPNTDTKVTQNNTTAANDYRILLSGQANDTTATEGANKSTNLRFNPSTKILSVGGSISATGDLAVTGNTNLNGETYAENITAGSLLVNGNTNFVQIPTAPTPAATSNDTSIATTAFVMNAFTANDAMVFKGVINTNGDLPTTHKQGWTYRVATANSYAGKTCEVGDIIICVTDGTTANNNHWAVIQNNVDGAVYRGANAFTDANIIVADSTNGKVKSSGKIITTTAPSSSAADTTIPTSKAVWSAISGASGYGKTGTVTSVRVQATSPVVSSSNAASSSTLDTTISLADGYGDTKNPYGTKTANYILAGPSSGNAVAPTFRKLVAADIPSLTKSKISDFPTNISAFTNDSGYVKSSGVTSITLKAGDGITLDTDNTAITSSGTRTISHKDTSSVANLTADGRKYVTGLTFDTYGHVTGYTTGTETVTNTDTKNTAGSTDTTSKIFLIGATSQADNPQTYSDSEIYVQNGTLYAVKTQDLSGTANNKPALIVGGADTSTHMEFDANEIQAKTNGTSVAQLYINNDGGLVTVGSGGLSITSLTASQAVSTDANKKLVSTNLTVSDPTANGTGITYIETISQNATGKITATKSTVRSASTSQTGVTQYTEANTNTQLSTLTTTWTATPTDDTLFIRRDTGGGATFGQVKFSTLWNYIKGKITTGTYWANIKISDAAKYNTTPEMATLKLNGNTNATAASTSNVTLVYDTTLQALNFVFA